jgi:hypothetical protein
MSQPVSAEPQWITVNTPRESDRVALVGATVLGTGAVLHTKVTGQRGAERTEKLGLTNAMRCALIRDLGGTP